MYRSNINYTTYDHNNNNYLKPNNMTVLITLTVAGTDSGPFNLYSNLDGYISAFETGVSRAALLAGYSSALVPDFTTIVRVQSTGDCSNNIDITLT